MKDTMYGCNACPNANFVLILLTDFEFKRPE